MNRILAAGIALVIAVALPAAAGAHAAHRHGHGGAHVTRVHRHDAARHARARNEHQRAAARHRRDRRTHKRPASAHRVPAHGADAGACANTSLTPEAGDLEVVREATLCLINRERVTRGERPLRLSGHLGRAAQGHSESMADEGYFAHEGPTGSTPLSRMKAARYINRPNVGYEVGENIAWGTLWLASPKAIVEAWMASPEHRENILDPRYQDTGLGIVAQVPGGLGEGQAGAVYTQDFGVLIAA